jgi:hypothetical protein
MCALYLVQRSSRTLLAPELSPRRLEKFQVLHCNCADQARSSLRPLGGSHGALAKTFRHMADRWFAGTPFEGLYPLEMEQEDFDHFSQRWQHYLDPSGFAAPPLPARPAPALPVPAAPTIMRRLFGRKGL